MLTYEYVIVWTNWCDSVVKLMEQLRELNENLWQLEY